MKKLRNSLLFWKLFISFVSLLIPLIIVTTLFYIRLVRNEKAKLTDTIQQSTYAAMNSLDNSIITARTASMMFLDTDIVANNEYPSSDMTIDQRLGQIQLIKQFAFARQVIGDISENTFLYGDDKTIIADGSYIFDDYFERISIFESYNDDFWRQSLKDDTPFKLLEPTDLRTDPEGQSKTVVPMIIENNINGVNLKIVLCLSADEILNRLKMNVSGTGTEFMVLTDSGNVVCNTADKESSAYLLKNYKNKKGVFDFRAKSKNYVGVCVFSNLFGWHYFTVIPSSAIRYPTSGLFALLLVASLMLVIGILFAVQLTLSIYKPIRHISTSLNWDAGAGTGRTSFGGNLNLIDKKVTALISAYSKASDENRMIVTDFVDDSLLMLLNGQTAEKLDRLESALQRVYGFNSEKYMCAGVQLWFADSFSTEVQDTERLELISVMKQAIYEAIVKYMPCYVFEYAKNYYICTLNTDNEEKILSAFRALIASFADYASYFSFSVAVGGFVGRLADVRGSFQQVSAALGNSGPVSASKIVSAKDYQVTAHYDYKMHDELDLIRLLKSGKLSDILQKVNDVLDNNLRHGVSQAGMQLLVQNFHFTGMRYLAERNEMLPDVNKYLELRYGGNILCNMENTKKLLEEFFEEIVCVTSDRNSDETNLTASIEKYVQKNYSQNLYLEKIAEDMGLSVKYISRIFKKTTAKNLADYINDVRMDRVRQLLTETNMSVREISEAVGIFSRSTFVRLFKKTMNVTPSEYRNIFQVKDS